jgi:SUF system NifU family Fe-S assembly protein
MSELDDLYQDIILNHNKRPRNYRKMPGATHHAEGHNPLCGDEVTVYLQIDGDTISDVSFDGQGCAISKASASLMTTRLKGKTLSEVRALAKEVRRPGREGTRSRRTRRPRRARWCAQIRRACEVCDARVAYDGSCARGQGEREHGVGRVYDPP